MKGRHADEKVDVVDDTEYRYATDWVNKLEDELHWRLYWKQQKLMDGLVEIGDNVLDIGVGTGFTANYLSSKGINVTTLDIDAGKNPDIVANIVSYDFADSYDAVLAFEVFEHIPFDQCQKVLPRVATSCRKRLFFSVPRNQKPLFRIGCKLPKIKPITWEWNIKRGQPMSPYHQWEIDYNEVTMRQLEDLVSTSGMKVDRKQEFAQRVFFACRPC